MTLAPGTKLGPYELLALIGVGGITFSKMLRAKRRTKGAHNETSDYPACHTDSQRHIDPGMQASADGESDRTRHSD